MQKPKARKLRTAKDSLGTIEIDSEALYSAQTQRAINNFPISGRRMPASFISALIIIKSTAAKLSLIHI